MPSVYAPCSTCHGARYKPQTLDVLYNGKNIAEVLRLTVDTACVFFAADSSVLRPLELLRDIGLGYLRLGQPATELSGGEPNASNWPPNYSGPTGAIRCMCWTNPLRDCTLQTLTG